MLQLITVETILRCLVSGDTMAVIWVGNDVAMINVDASATMSGMYQGGSGYDILQLVEGVAQDNGALVDFDRGFNANVKLKFLIMVA